MGFHFKKVSKFYSILLILMIIFLQPSFSRRGRGRSRVKAKLGSHRLPIGAKWKDDETAKYYEHPGGAKIKKASHFDLEYTLGHKIWFMCIAEGNPLPEITWFKDGVEIYSHQHLMIHEWRIGHKIKSKMEIDPATQRDQGLYDCIAHNKYSYDRRSFRTELDLD